MSTEVFYPDFVILDIKSSWNTEQSTSLTNFRFLPQSVITLDIFQEEIKFI